MSLSLNISNYENLNEQKYINFIFILLRICKLSINQICSDGNWNWWIAHVGALIIATLGITANIISYIIFHNKCKKSSYINMLKYLAIIDSLCLLIEFIKSLNATLIYADSAYSFMFESNFSCKFFNYTISTLQLISAWLVCLFTIERCFAINSPLRVRRIFSIQKTRAIFSLIIAYAFLSQLFRLFLIESSCPPLKSSSSFVNQTTTVFINFGTNENCLARCKCEAVSNKYGVFLLQFHVYFHQLVSIVIVPSVIVIICNTIVIYRIIQRKRMLYVNQNKYRKRFQQQQQPQQQKGEETSSPFSSTTNNNKKISIDDNSETLVISRKQIKFRRQTIYLLILVSISFLVLVLPDTGLNIYKFIYLKDLIYNDDDDADGNSKSSGYNQIGFFCSRMKHLVLNIQILEDVFFLLKLVNYASTCFIYLSLGKSLSQSSCILSAPSTNQHKREPNRAHSFTVRFTNRLSTSSSTTTTFETRPSETHKLKKSHLYSSNYNNNSSSINKRLLNKQKYEENL